MGRFRTIGLSPLVVAALGCASLQQAQEEEFSVANCMRESALYDWQRLDAGNVIVWTYPGEQAYHVRLDTDVRPLTFVNALEFVDGNRDGFVCDEGWDSLLAVFNASDSVRPTSAAIEESTIHYVRALSPDGVVSLRAAHAETLGDRIRGGGPSI